MSQTGSGPVEVEVVRALFAVYCEDFETGFDQLCEEAGISPSEVEEFRP